MSLRVGDNFPSGVDHKVQVYQGSLAALSFDKEYTPEKHRVFKSFVLSNVENIEISGEENSPFANMQVYDFTQLIIIEPKIESAHSINGATYGELSGMAYGITKSRPKINRLDPPDPPPTNPDGPTNSGNGFTGNTGFNDNSEIGGYVEQAKSGCSRVYSGCLENFWRIISYILLLLFLWWLIKSCSKMSEKEDCAKRDATDQQHEKLKKERDSLRVRYEDNLDKTLANINKIYFYKGTPEIHQYSLGENGNLQRLMKLISVYDDKEFILVGHHSGSKLESTNLDQLRAEKIRTELINAGISGNRLEIQTKGNSAPLENNVIDPYMFPDYSLRYYNRNMRVEVKVKAKK